MRSIAKTMIAIGLVLCLPHRASAQTPNWRDSSAARDMAVLKQLLQQLQTEQAARANAAGDPFARDFFPPELVMAHQQAIALTERQRNAIQDVMKASQEKFVDLQFKMSAESEKLQQLIKGTSVDEAKVLDEVDRVLAIEREVKRAQLSLMIRTKNQLTEQQQAALRLLRKQDPRDDANNSGMRAPPQY